MGQAAKSIHIVGAGLAGSECAYQLAERGHKVVLHEMRDKIKSPAHQTGLFAELVCSNSFGSQTDYSAPGQLKWEAKKLGSLILASAEKAAVPAGMALGVDRQVFASAVTNAIKSHPNIEVRSEVVEDIDSLPRPLVIATGPLTHDKLADSLRAHFDNQFLYFFDAIAPIVDTESIDMDIAWKADRWGKGNDDYINCPLNKEQYFEFVESINNAKKIETKEFEKTPYFESCMPIEAIVERGPLTLRFGPFSPKGLANPKTGKNEFAILQLRQENLEATAYNLVGCQTKMTYGDQKEVFRKVPGLHEADFLKLGSIHRNLYIHTPKLLTEFLASKKDPDLYFAGQITGVEGYFESTCIGLVVAGFIDDKEKGREIKRPPRASALGSLLNAITEEKDRFQPTNINFSLFPTVEGKEFRGRRGKEARREYQISLAQKALLENSI